MTDRNEAIRMARSVADKDKVDPLNPQGDFLTLSPDELARLITLVKNEPKIVGYAVMTPYGNVHKFAHTLESAERKQKILKEKFPEKKQGGIKALYVKET